VKKNVRMEVLWCLCCFVLSGNFVTSVSITSSISLAQWCQCSWFCHWGDKCSVSTKDASPWCCCRG